MINVKNGRSLFHTDLEDGFFFGFFGYIIINLRLNISFILAANGLNLFFAGKRGCAEIIHLNQNGIFSGRLAVFQVKGKIKPAGRRF